MKRKYQIGVIGSAGPEEYPSDTNLSPVFKEAYKIGKLLAKKQAVLVCGGKGGIMEYASKGAKEYGGTTVGIVKGDKRYTANKFIDIEIVTNMGSTSEEAILVSSCDGIIAIGGGAGTLEEISIAYRKNITIVALTNIEGWSKDLAGKYLDRRETVKIYGAGNSKEAVKILFEKINK